jgi:hypothetical protein
MKTADLIPGESEGYERRQERRDCIKVVVEVFTFLAIVVYAGLTYCLLKTNQAQVEAIDGSNQIAENNSHADLRAYVSLGDKNGQWLQIAKHQVNLLFYNAGRTPARHFSVRVSIGQAGVKEQPLTITHIERIQIVSGWGKGGIVSTAGGSDVAGGEIFSWPLSRADVDFTKAWSMTTYYEYCDIFGRWHCDASDLRNDPKHGASYFHMPAFMFCDPEDSPYLDEIRKTNGPEEVKKYKKLEHCDQGD